MSKRISATFTDQQIQKLIGTLGRTQPDVITTIVTIWLYQEQKRDKEK